MLIVVSISPAASANVDVRVEPSNPILTKLLGSNLDPVIRTLDPAAPLCLFKLMDAEVVGPLVEEGDEDEPGEGRFCPIVNVAVATAPFASVPVTVCGPLETEGARKLAKTLPNISGRAAATMLLSKEKLTITPTENPCPLILTGVPTMPCAGVKVIVGLFAPIVTEMDAIKLSTMREKTTVFIILRLNDDPVRLFNMPHALVTTNWCLCI